MTQNGMGAVGSGGALWASLSSAWRRAYEEAWESFRRGNYGIGAALVDGAGNVVSSGRNQVVSAPDDQRLGGNYMAHAEMNLFAGMATYDAQGFHLTSTLQPCLMCAGTALFLNVDSISYAAPDEFFANLDDLWPHHPYTAERAVPTSQGMNGPLASFARLLPLSHTFATLPDSPQAAVARRAHPDLSDVASDGDFVSRLRSHRTVEAAIDSTLSRLTP